MDPEILVALIQLLAAVVFFGQGEKILGILFIFQPLHKAKDER